jgi:hypothetical protein
MIVPARQSAHQLFELQVYDQDVIRLGALHPDYIIVLE